MPESWNLATEVSTRRVPKIEIHFAEFDFKRIQLQAVVAVADYQANIPRARSRAWGHRNRSGGDAAVTSCRDGASNRLYQTTLTIKPRPRQIHMDRIQKLEIGISGLGLLLTALGVLMPECFPLVLLGTVLTAVGVGMLLPGASGPE